MKIKVFENSCFETAEELVNDFESNHKVRATQSHVTLKDDFLIYTFVVFYEE